MPLPHRDEGRVKNLAGPETAATPSYSPDAVPPVLGLLGNEVCAPGEHERDCNTNAHLFVAHHFGKIQDTVS